MPFDLKISFSGQCMFVPEPLNGGPRGRMHVLLPTPREHHGAHRHVAVVGFDTAHLREGNSARDGTTAVMSLHGHTLKVGGEGATLNLPFTVANLREATGKSINSKYLGTGDHQELVAKVSLEAGMVLTTTPGASWEWESGRTPREFTHEVIWCVEDIDATTFTLELFDFKGAPVPGVKPHTLHPIPDGTREAIHLFVHHIPSGDLPPHPEEHHAPEAGAEAPHFANFYRLFDVPVLARIPRFAGMVSPSNERGATPFNCMVAGTWP